jgi:hypothetical protein
MRMRPRTAAAMTVRAVGPTDGPVPGHLQVMECNALSGGAAGREHLFQLAKVAGVGS